MKRLIIKWLQHERELSAQGSKILALLNERGFIDPTGTGTRELLEKALVRITLEEANKEGGKK